MSQPTRIHAGRVNGVHAEPGAILGPKEVTREYVTVTGDDERGVTLGYARREDVDGPALSVIAENPRTVAEVRLAMAAQAPITARLRWLFGGAR